MSELLTKVAAERILVVEDDYVSAFMMKELFESLGLHADVVNSAPECLDCLRVKPNDYALILMDIHMPHMTGVDATLAIRAKDHHPPRDLPVVAMTADTRFAEKSLREQYGIDDYLPKPISVKAVIDVCERLAGIRLS